MTRERPILFRPEMVRAILDGRKTVTRRLIDARAHARLGLNGVAFAARIAPTVPPAPIVVMPGACRYGGPGDVLRVRETWAPADDMAGGTALDEPVAVAYAADHTARWWGAENPGAALDTTAWNWKRFKWRPSIFMPKWACRLRLEVVSVRPERVQSIDEADAQREGVTHETPPCFEHTCPTVECLSHRAAFERAWRLMHGDESWERNDWVWRIEFSSTGTAPKEPTP